MQILEALKNFLKPENKKFDNSDDNLEISQDLNDINIGFYDNGKDYSNGFIDYTKNSKLVEQAHLIEKYRQIADFPDVQDAIDEICNEISFKNKQDEFIIKINLNEDNDALFKKISKRWSYIHNNILKLNKNIYNLIRQLYIDGQLNFYLQYSKNELSKISVLEPFYLYYDKSEKKYKYAAQLKNKYDFKNSTVFDNSDENIKIFMPEEFVHIDSSIYKDGLIRSWLHNSLVLANQLKNMEDTLVPIRFNRSVSRRVFNVDVSGLSNTKVEAAINKIKAEYKYRTFYNPEDGTIKKDTRFLSMVENYWFANRSGSKGTTVDILDEKGQLGELDDIKYIRKKLFRSMSIPTTRILDTDNPQDFDYNNETIPQETLKFILYVQRIKNVFIEAIIEIFKRDIVSNNIMNENEYDEFINNNKLSFSFSNENKIFEKMEQVTLLNKNDIITQMSDNIGKIYSWQYIAKTVLGLDDNQFKDVLKEIKKEKSDSLTKFLYEEE